MESVLLLVTRAKPTKDAIANVRIVPARDYQIECRQASYNYFVKCAQEHRAPSGLVCLPTGTGKGFCIADITADIVQRYPGQRVMIATHVKELVDQNYKELVGDPDEGKIGLWELAPAGIFSAGLGRKDYLLPIIFGGVKSIANSISKFQVPDIFIIDEADLLSPKDDTSYRLIIKAFRLVKPNMIVLGYTATPWRQAQGLLTEGEGALFTDFIIDLTTMAAWERFVDEGYLLRPIPRRTVAQIDTSEVPVASTGDYVGSELEEASDKITYEACREMVEGAAERRSWLVFAAGIKHAEHVAKTLQSFGIEALTVHSKVEKGQRDERIRRLKRYDLRCIVTNNVLTVGFNHPGLDFIGMLRPTMSVRLWVQMLGRGTRPMFVRGFDLGSIEGRLASIAASHKQDCLVMDFAKNSEKLGPINDPCIPSKKRKGGAGLAPIRICELCGTYNHANASVCISCGAIFERMPKIVPQASRVELFKELEPVIEEYDVQEVNYYLHTKDNAPPSIKVEYGVAGTYKRFTQYITLEQTGQPLHRARNWWKQRSFTEPPSTTVEALLLAQQGALRKPKNVRVWCNKKYPEIIGFGW
jgi:DNA repair protein RadD